MVDRIAHSSGPASRRAIAVVMVRGVAHPRGPASRRAIAVVMARSVAHSIGPASRRAITVVIACGVAHSIGPAGVSSIGVIVGGLCEQCHPGHENCRHYELFHKNLLKGVSFSLRADRFPSTHSMLYRFPA